MSCLYATQTQSCGVQPAEMATKAPPQILDNVLDLGSTIAKILTICGMDNAKATKAVSGITTAFMNFDEKQTGERGTCKTRHLRKADLIQNLRTQSCMSEAEAKLTASVVKCAFRAFYHKQSVRKYDPGLYSEDDWKNAAEKTITAFAKAGASKSELELAARRIQEAYKGYLDRVSFKWPPRKPSACDALNKANCFHCSAKNDGMNNMAPALSAAKDIPQQVICTCCGCLKTSPVSYRDSKGRSILLVEDNSLFYNTQVMKNELDSMKIPGPCDQTPIPACQENLSRALYKLTHDMINRIVKGGKVDPSAFADSEGDNKAQNYDQNVSESQETSKNRIVCKEREKVSKKSSAQCECKKQRKTKSSHKKDSESSSGVRTPPNSYDDHYADFRRTKRSASQPIVEIALKGVYKCENGRPKMEIVGLKLMENEYTNPAEFICKRRVRVKNRYTQTGGSAGPSQCSSSASSKTALSTGKTSGRSKSSKASTKRQSFGSENRASFKNASTDKESLSDSPRNIDNKFEFAKPEQAEEVAYNPEPTEDESISEHRANTNVTQDEIEITSIKNEEMEAKEENPDENEVHDDVSAPEEQNENADSASQPQLMNADEPENLPESLPE